MSPLRSAGSPASRPIGTGALIGIEKKFKLKFIFFSFVVKNLIFDFDSKIVGVSSSF
jgi:hypothetical protein